MSRIALPEEFFQAHGLCGFDFRVPGFKHGRPVATFGKVGLDLLIPRAGVLLVKPRDKRSLILFRQLANRPLDNIQSHITMLLSTAPNRKFDTAGAKSGQRAGAPLAASKNFCDAL